MSDATLTPKQQGFVDEYLVDLNATAAYKRAGYRATGNAAEVGAHKLVRNAKVASEIDRRRAVLSRDTRITQERVVSGLIGIAEDVNEPASARVSAYNSVARILGYIVERREVKADVAYRQVTEAFATLSDSELRALIRNEVCEANQ